MVTGTLPFYDKNMSRMFVQIMSAKFTLPEYVSPSLKDLIGKIFITKPATRATLSYIRRDIWTNLNRTEVENESVTDKFPDVDNESVMKLKELGLQDEFIQEYITTRKPGSIKAALYLTIPARNNTKNVQTEKYEEVSDISKEKEKYEGVSEMALIELNKILPSSLFESRIFYPYQNNETLNSSNTTFIEKVRKLHSKTNKVAPSTFHPSVTRLYPGNFPNIKENILNMTNEGVNIISISAKLTSQVSSSDNKKRCSSIIECEYKPPDISEDALKIDLEAIDNSEDEDEAIDQLVDFLKSNAAKRIKFYCLREANEWIKFKLDGDHKLDDWAVLKFSEIVQKIMEDADKKQTVFEQKRDQS